MWTRFAILTCALLACEEDAVAPSVDASGDEMSSPFGGPCVDALAPATFAKLETCAPCPPTLPDSGEPCDGDVLEAPSTLCGPIAAQFHSRRNATRNPVQRGLPRRIDGTGHSKAWPATAANCRSPRRRSIEASPGAILLS